jgi:DNA damage-binding protein 1
MAGSDTVRLVDDQTFEMLDRYCLDPMELGACVCSMSFAEDDSTYYVVGSAYTEPDESESKKVPTLSLCCVLNTWRRSGRDSKH